MSTKKTPRKKKPRLLHAEIRFLSAGQVDPLTGLQADLAELAQEQVLADVALVQATENAARATQEQAKAVARKTKAERAYASARTRLSASLTG